MRMHDRMADDDILVRQSLILDLAARIERDRNQCLHWFVDDGIAELGDRTAYQLMCAGYDADVIAFLLKVIRMELRPCCAY